MGSFSWPSALLIAAAILPAFPRAARADDAKVMWTFEADPWPCEDFLPALAKEVELACEASGGACGIATEKDAATFHAVLVCRRDERAPWTLAAHVNGEGDEQVWNVTLAGEPEQRLRNGALWIARTPAPEPKSKTEPTPPPPIRAPPPSREEMPPVDRGETTEPRRHSYGGLTAEGVYAIGGDGTREDGGRLAAYLPGRFSMHLGFSFSFTHATVTNSTLVRDGWTGRSGALFAVGAPWSDTFAGFALEGGLAVGARNGPLVTAAGANCVSFPGGAGCQSSSLLQPPQLYDRFVGPFAAATLVLQLPARLPVNLSTSMTGEVDDYYGSAVLFFVFRAGVSWRAW